jgi:hypothetical protein
MRRSSRYRNSASPNLLLSQFILIKRLIRLIRLIILINIKNIDNINSIHNIHFVNSMHTINITSGNIDSDINHVGNTGQTSGGVGCCDLTALTVHGCHGVDDMAISLVTKLFPKIELLRIFPDSWREVGEVTDEALATLVRQLPRLRSQPLARNLEKYAAAQFWGRA